MSTKSLVASVLMTLCLGVVQVFAQEKTVHGSVVDNSGLPVIGANVVEKGNTSNGAFTDVKGEFSLIVPQGATLVVSALSYQTLEYAVKGNSFTIVLEEDSELMDELVVTALGVTRSEKALGYASQKFDGDNLQKVKGANIATSLSGRISGMRVYNSTQFNKEPDIRLRGEKPLIVVDGVPTDQSFRDFNQDVIESITVLKGATASALYGSRGGNGAIMITTKRGGDKGFKVELNSSNMFFAGYLKIPEVQTSYSSGSGSKFDNIDYVWGSRLDAGVMAEQWNPITKQYEMAELTSKGKNNFRNFLEFSMVSNTTLSASAANEHGSIRTSMSYLYNKNPYPNHKLDKYWFNVSGDLKLGKRAKIDAALNYSNEQAPNYGGEGYGTGYIYNILIWTGPEYDLRDYKDYWIVPNEKQNWHYSNYYDNPYFEAYEKIKTIDKFTINGSLNFTYDILPGFKFQARAGGVSSQENNIIRSSVGTISKNRNGWNDGALGFYEEDKATRKKFNYDAFFLFDQKLGNFKLDGLLGGSIYTYSYDMLKANTKNGLSVPGFYSLAASVDTPSVSPTRERKQVNSLFGTLTVGWREIVYLNASGRNDWSSTMPSSERSYFYPSVGLSFVGSTLAAASWMPFWKLRGSWTTSKTDLGIYEMNQSFSISQGVWNGLSTESAPASLYGGVKPITNRTWEVGASMYFLENSSLKVDVSYFDKLTFNNTTSQTISSSTGYSTRLMNTEEEYTAKGFEFTLDAGVIQNPDFKWNATLNLSTAHTYYSRIDAEYSADNIFVGVGKRKDYYAYKDLVKDPQGNVIHQSNGYPTSSNYNSLAGYTDPDFEFGFANTFRYKNLSMTMNFDGRVGGVCYAQTEFRMLESGSHPDTDNQWRYDEVVNGKKNYVGPGVKIVSGSVKYDTYGNIVEDTRVFAPNDIEVSYENYVRKSKADIDKIVQDKTFIKLRELSLGYDIPRRFTSKVGLSDCYFGIVGQNLFVLTKEFRFQDPDGLRVSSDEDICSPSVRYVGFNLKLGF